MWEIESRATDLEADEEMVVRLVVVEHGDDHHATAAYVHQEVLVRCKQTTMKNEPSAHTSRSCQDQIEDSNVEPGQIGNEQPAKKKEWNGCELMKDCGRARTSLEVVQAVEM